MKKRIMIAALVAVTTLSLLTGCGEKVKCDFCGETKRCSKIEVLGQEGNICGDCEDSIDELKDGIGNLFG